MPADSGPAADEVRRFPRISPPRPRPRPLPRPRLRRASRFASSAFLCSCIFCCSSAMRARSDSLRRTPLGLNLAAADPRVDGAGAGTTLEDVGAAGSGAGAASGTDSEETVITGTGAGPALDAAAGVLDSDSAPSEVCAATREAAAADAPRAVPPRPRPRPRVVVFGGICDFASGDCVHRSELGGILCSVAGCGMRNQE